MSKQLPSSILLTMVDQMKNYKISEAGEVVSTCDLGPGEVVLMLPPVASGPGRANVPVCLGCLKATGYQEQITQEEAWMYGEPPVVKLVQSHQSGITGHLRIAQISRKSEVIITGWVDNLPKGIHGFHVHENGATGNNCADAGAHFNPTSVS